MYNVKTTHNAAFRSNSRIDLIYQMLQLQLTLLQNEAAEICEDLDREDSLGEAYQHLTDALAAVQAIDSDFSELPAAK